MVERRIAPIIRAPSRRRRSRIGKGFSVKEIQDAGLTVVKAKELGVMIDGRRRTCYPENTRRLRVEYVTTLPLTEIKGIGESTEKELIHAGIFDAQDLAETNIDELSTKVKYSKKKLRDWQTEAKKITEEEFARPETKT